jgi:DNA polymerase-3 subunit delta'
MIYPWQSTQWQQIQAQISEQRLPHALLLSGQPGMGKWHFARELAARLLCSQPDDTGACGRCSACKLLRAGTHPDALLVAPEQEDKAIRVDDIRELSRQLVLTSQLGGYKVALIAFADNMNINAANSLLKTLEEPTDGSVLLLVSSRPHRLPITIRSRCQRIDFPPPAANQALQWLQQQGLDNAQSLLTLAHGSPLLAQRLAEEELLVPRKELLAALLGQQPVLEAAAALAKWPLDHLLGWLYDWLGDLIKIQQQPGAVLVHQEHRQHMEQLAGRIPGRDLYGLLDEVLKLKRAQSIPLNAQLLWEDLLISWERLTTRAKAEG